MLAQEVEVVGANNEHPGPKRRIQTTNRCRHDQRPHTESSGEAHRKRHYVHRVAFVEVDTAQKCDRHHSGQASNHHPSSVSGYRRSRKSGHRSEREVHLYLDIAERFSEPGAEDDRNDGISADLAPEQRGPFLREGVSRSPHAIRALIRSMASMGKGSTPWSRAWYTLATSPMSMRDST